VFCHGTEYYSMCGVTDSSLCVCICIHLACLEAGAEFSPVYHPGIWLSKSALYSCCDTINKRSSGCLPITHKVPESQRQLC